MVVAVMLASAASVRASAWLPPVPPLGDAARVVLAAADDDTDRLGEPVAVVLDVVRRAAGATEVEVEVETLVPPPLDVAAMLSDPEGWRGRLVRIVGRLEQRSPRPSAGPDVGEWFVRTDDGPVAVLVADAGMQGKETPRVGAAVQVDGWVIRRAAGRGRDGIRRTWPLLVAAPGRAGALGDSAGAGAGAGAVMGGASWLAALVVLLAAGLLAVSVARRLSRRGGASSSSSAAARLAARRARRGPEDGAAMRATPSDPTLPTDAAEALGALRSRAENANGFTDTDTDTHTGTDTDTGTNTHTGTDTHTGTGTDTHTGTGTGTGTYTGTGTNTERSRG